MGAEEFLIDTGMRTFQFHGQRALQMADQCLFDFEDEGMAVVDEAQEKLLSDIERVIRRTAGGYKKLLDEYGSELCHETAPMTVFIPIENRLLCRIFELIGAFDEAVALIDRAWLNGRIPIGKHGAAIRQLEGRLYRTFKRLHSNFRGGI